jgi:hypothetical protein
MLEGAGGNLTGRRWEASRAVVLIIHGILSVASTPKSNLMMETQRLPDVGLEPNYDRNDPLRF